MAATDSISLSLHQILHCLHVEDGQVRKRAKWEIMMKDKENIHKLLIFFNFCVLDKIAKELRRSLLSLGKVFATNLQLVCDTKKRQQRPKSASPTRKQEKLGRFVTKKKHLIFICVWVSL